MIHDVAFHKMVNGNGIQGCDPQVVKFFGAGEMNRTPDLLITNELLYRLSYTGFRPQL